MNIYEYLCTILSGYIYISISSLSLTCGEPVESTPYDFLEGVARRDQFSIHPEPEVAMAFKKTTDDQSVDLVEVEKLLKKLLNEVSTCMYNYVVHLSPYYCNCRSGGSECVRLCVFLYSLIGSLYIIVS